MKPLEGKGAVDYMKRRSILGLCLVAVCAIFAFVASSALAEGSLEYGKCAKKTGGKYKNAGCTKVAKSLEEEKFEWTPLSTAVKFESKKKELTANAVLESVKETEISCKEQFQKKEGEYGPGPYEVKNVVGEFTGCEALGAECQSAGKGAGEIDTKKLHGEVGTVTKVTKEEKNIDGNDLRGQEAANGEGDKLLAEFTCGPAPVKVRGGVVVKAQTEGKNKTNKMLNKIQVEFNTTKPGKQVPEKWTPGGHGISNAKHEEITEFLEGKVATGAYEQSGQALITIQKTVPKSIKVELRQCEGSGVNAC
jgi:hypothetical protein